ncbi:MAG: hypothetical protein FWB95_08210 [Treponema sp.]|nr:hypothetical protein [Treponema sp.]
MFNHSLRFKKALAPQVKFPVLIMIVLFIIIPSESVSADIFQWSLLGNILVFPANSGASADPFPVLPSGGASVSVRIWGPIRAEFTEDIYFKYYEYNSTLGYPTAGNQENRSALVIGFFTAIQITGYFTLGDKGTALRVYAGPAADLRAVVLSPGLNFPGDFNNNDIEKNPQLQTDAIRNYFWSGKRWFMPVAGVGMDFSVSESFLLGFDLRVWFPVYKIKSEENLPAIDGWRFGVGLRVTPLIKKKV